MDIDLSKDEDCVKGLILFSTHIKITTIKVWSLSPSLLRKRDDYSHYFTLNSVTDQKKISLTLS